jgi:hypothetical protein
MNKMSLRDMTNLVSLLTPAGRTSMRVMISELESLPPVTLNVGINTTEAVVPFAPVLNISATSGAVIDTRIVLYEGGKELGEYHLPSPAGVAVLDSSLWARMEPMFWKWSGRVFRIPGMWS